MFKNITFAESPENMEWFESWFNCPYYHLLYKNRNSAEANAFLHQLIPYLNPSKEAKFLDICCGKGRHSLTINEMGYDTIGFDLAMESIEEAKKLENDTLKFYVHDMRKLFFTNYFDFALNLFTSFGYFNSSRDNLNTLHSFNKALKPGGKLVIDYFNAVKVRKELINNETKQIEDITFHISKKIENNRIVKQIQFNKDGKPYEYLERVELIDLDQFTNLLNTCGFRIMETFGNYQLNSFHSEESDRLIILAVKEK